MRPKTFKPAEALEAAMVQFWESGYAGSSMQDLVDCMGISRQSLYDTFGNKRDLFAAVLRRYRDEVIGEHKALIRDPGKSPEQAVRTYYEKIASSDPQNPVPVGCLLVRSATELPLDDPEFPAFLLECVEEMRDVLTDVIRRGQATGEFDSARSAEELASLVVSQGMGLHAMRRLPNRAAGLCPSIDTLMKALKGSGH